MLLRTILGLQRPQAGEVKLEGRDITHLSWNELRAAKAGYGVTFQQGALYTSLTVLQNIQLPMLEHLSLPPDALDALARLKLAIVGLPANAAEKYPSPLSGGKVKRAALARSRPCCSSTSPRRASIRSAPPRSMRSSWRCRRTSRSRSS